MIEGLTQDISLTNVLIIAIASAIIFGLIILIYNNYMKQTKQNSSDYMKKEGENIPKTSHKNKYMHTYILP